jgi:hypothetical protein
MIFSHSKLPYFQGMYEVFVLDKPKSNLNGLQDASKNLWFNRGYGVTNWRYEGKTNWHVLIGEIADTHGKLRFEPSQLKSKWGGQGVKHLENHLGTMVNMGQIRRDGATSLASNLYQLTLTLERQPSISPEFVNIPLVEYEATIHCYCSTTSSDVMYLGCEVCRKLVLAVIKSYYGNYWLEMEEAITKRDTADAPAKFEQSKVPIQDRAMIVDSIGKMLHLCSKSKSYTKLDTSRLFWLVSDAQNRIHINPNYFPDHRDSIPNASSQFMDAHKRDKVEGSGRTHCWKCDSISLKGNKFCSSCGSRMNPLS